MKAIKTFLYTFSLYSILLAQMQTVQVLPRYHLLTSVPLCHILDFLFNLLTSYCLLNMYILPVPQICIRNNFSLYL